MSLFESRYYRLNTFFLTCTGQWPYQTTVKKRFIRIGGFISLMLALIPMIARIYMVWGDLDATLDCLPPLCIVLTSISKSTVYMCKEQELTELLECIKSDWILWSSGKEFDILRAYAEDGRSFSILFTGNIYVTVITFITMSMSPIVLDKLIPLNETRPKQMVYPVELFVDHEKYFNWILLYGILTSMCAMTIILACESMYAVSTQHACGLFAIISHRLRNAIEEVEFVRTTNKQRMEDALYEYMILSIERHNHAIKFANILEACYSPFLFFGMAFNMLETSVTGLQTLLALGNLDKTVKFGSFTLGVIIHIFLISLPAQRLLDHSSAVGRDVYDGSWYLLPLKAKKLIGMIIMQTGVPCTLTALRFYSVNLTTFSSILKSSFSYFTLLSSARK